MNSREFAKMIDLENRYWWFVGRKSVIDSVLRKTFDAGVTRDILDIGCGVGSIFDTLGKYGRVVGADVSEVALSYCRQRGMKDLVKSSAEKLEVEDESFDLVTAFDILEHLDDDGQGLSEMYRVCKKGGYALITVPAYRFLWSGHDRALGHRRRYLYAELKDKVESAGFEVNKLSYFVFFLFPVTVAFRIVERFIIGSKKRDTSYITPPGFINSMFIKLLELEGKLINYFGFKVGLSILCLARKAEDDRSDR
jgi:ubiquinone/menaquinone biosynthesis C-methylase UbiE